MCRASTTSPRSSRPSTARVRTTWSPGCAAGLETQLGPTWPEGVEVSFGQWQKLALARGFMRDHPLLLVLDEPTAALDAETEHALFERYAAAARREVERRGRRADGRITILVSHRFSTVRMADLIVVLDGARVVEVGSHEELDGQGRPVRGALRHPGGGVPLRSEDAPVVRRRVDGLARRVQVPLTAVGSARIGRAARHRDSPLRGMEEPRMPAKNPDLHGNAPDKADVALLLIDVINDLEFPEGEQLLRFAVPMADRIARLKERARRAGVPVIYVNDNFGRWRSDFNAQVEHCLEDGVRGRPVVERLRPEEDDYFVLKPKHSGFFSTTLDVLLEYLGAKTLILTGMAANICVLFTANDAYMRDFHLVVPADCVASNTEEENRHALEQMRKVLKADTRPSDELRLEELGRRR